ncbi:protein DETOXIFICATION 42-like isoform X1 [Miscanthus floridulus]|uniref:protein DETOXIFICATION 42-like isoform X1 n=2 Tax=Miscanthus floridulus TaxID=154761 RepID=UPI003459E0E6
MVSVVPPLLMLYHMYGGTFCRYLIASILLWRLRLHVDLFPPSFKHLQFGRFLKNGFLLLARVIAATFCVTLSASMAARLGSTPMAAFQICLQTWLACSLLADGLAFAGQAILASAFARKDYPKATATASRILQLALVLGLILSILLGIGLRIGSRLFTDDQGVLHHIYIGIPFDPAKLKKLHPSFKENGGTVTAGNASSISPFKFIFSCIIILVISYDDS